MRFKSRPKHSLAFWLILAVVVIVWVWNWPARQPIHDTIDHLKGLGYACAPQPETESVYFCADKDGRDPAGPKTKTSLWLYSPYKVAEAEKLMDDYCQHPHTTRLIEQEFIPTAWEIDRQAVIMPHELYGREDIIDQYPQRKAWLDSNFRQIPEFSMSIDLDTRCLWYTNEPAGGSLV